MTSAANTTTDSHHDGSIFPNLPKDMAPDGPDVLWVADLTYVAIAKSNDNRWMRLTLDTVGRLA